MHWNLGWDCTVPISFSYLADDSKQKGTKFIMKN